MHRSASSTRVSDEFTVSVSPLMEQSAASKSMVSDQLPTYDPLSGSSKEMAKLRASENAVHVIPVVLIVCAFVLWFFSHPAVGVVNTMVPLLPNKRLNL